MKIVLRDSRNRYSGPWGFVAQVVVMTLSAITAAYLLPGVHIGNLSTAILTAAVIALLNSFIRPILIVLTLPFTIVSMGLFLLVINAVIILLAAGMVPQFSVDGFGWALFFSLLITGFNYLLEIPNRLMRRPEYQSSDQQGFDQISDTDDEGFAEYEEIHDENTNQ